MKETIITTAVSAEFLRFHLKNLSPGMLQNPGNDPDFLDTVLRQRQQSQKRTDWTVQEEAGTKLYRSESEADDSPSKMGFPMQNLIACLVGAGRYVKSGKNQISTAKSTTLFEFLDFPEDFCVFKDVDKDGNIPYYGFLAKGNLDSGGKKVAVAITRPRIPHWETSFTVRLDTKRGVSRDTVVALVETAGRKIGLCDWNPIHRGRFGRFVISKMEILPVKDAKVEISVVEYDLSDAPADLRELAGV
ncbi:MAG: hypothetical protein UX81_C0020G0001 [Parcubacteria group bacterium GW2011_GWA2_47_12]|nr:MAG: hypothetical protein UX81_C0020G0001 [Parcubacteria group bacterium GW2011_GWA2_47_12]